MQSSVAITNYFQLINPLRLITKMNFKIFLVLSVFIMALLTGFYMFQINLMAVQNYLIINYEKQINALDKENRSLEVNFAKANSLGNIEALAKNLNFERVETVQYIKMIDGQMARGGETPK